LNGLSAKILNYKSEIKVLNCQENMDLWAVIW